MKFLRQSSRIQPKISLILLDWSVRESFHLLHYLKQQTLPRELFEVIIVEYYSTVSPAVKAFEAQVDTWLLLEVPTSSYYHKHLMYNIGLIYSKGEITIICDSDAMVKPTFLATIVSHFENHPNTVLHLDQFRNNHRGFYPFNYPSFDDVIGEECINNSNGMTTGVMLKEDPIHQRNYGACFCAKREDLMAIGGADEHIDLVGYICGPYDLTFRLLNLGREEVWHEREFLYHTWHPGQTGTDNYFGPHDGRHMSSTSLEALVSRRIEPHVKNAAFAQLQQTEALPETHLLFHPDLIQITAPVFLEGKAVRRYAEETYQTIPYKGFLITKLTDQTYQANSLAKLLLNDPDFVFTASSLQDIKQQILSSLIYPKWIWMLIYLRTYYSHVHAVWRNQKSKKIRNQKTQSAGNVTTHALLGKIKRLLYRVHQVRCEVRMLTEFSNDLVSNVLLVKQKGSLHHVQIWLANRRDYVTLKILILLKVIPPLRLKWFSAFEELEKCQAEIATKESNRIVVSRELFTRYPSWFVPKLDKFMAVL